jgi:hypothetical protein
MSQTAMLQRSKERISNLDVNALTPFEKKLSKLSENEFVKFGNFYNFVFLVNGKSSQFFPLEDDYDKIKDFEEFLFDNIKDDDKHLFEKLCDMMINYDIVDTKVLTRYILHEGNFYKRVVFDDDTSHKHEIFE